MAAVRDVVRGRVVMSPQGVENELGFAVPSRELVFRITGDSKARGNFLRAVRQYGLQAWEVERAEETGTYDTLGRMTHRARAQGIKMVPIAWRVMCSQTDTGVANMARLMELFPDYHLPVSIRVSFTCAGSGPEKVKGSNKPSRGRWHGDSVINNPLAAIESESANRNLPFGHSAEWHKVALAQRNS